MDNLRVDLERCMNGLILLGNREMEVRTFLKPKPGPGQATVKLKASGLCGSDLPHYRSSTKAMKDQNSLIVGHEACGVIDEVGQGLRRVQVGDRVMIHPYTGCGNCKHCRASWTQLCLKGPKISGSHIHGADADYELVNEYMCVLMPEDLGFEEGAACACGTGTAYQALKRFDLSKGETLAVFGQGPVGLSVTCLGAAMGAKIIAVDPVAMRRKLAEQLGAWQTIDPSDTEPVEAIMGLTRSEGTDASLDATGIEEVQLNAIRSTRTWGRTCLVGVGGTLTIEPLTDIIKRQITLMGSWTLSSEGMKELADFVVDHNLPIRDLITHRFSLDMAEDAFKLFNSATTGKVVFVWD